MRLSFMVVERHEELLEKERDKTQKREWATDRFDPSKFKGRIQFAIIEEDGEASFWETIELTIKDRDAFNKLELGKVLPVQIGENV